LSRVADCWKRDVRANVVLHLLVLAPLFAVLKTRDGEGGCD